MDKSDIDLAKEQIPEDVREELEKEAMEMSGDIDYLLKSEYNMTLEDFIESGKEVERELEGEGIEFHHTLYRQK